MRSRALLLPLSPRTRRQPARGRLLLPPLPALCLLAAGLTAALAVDLRTLGEPLAPGWYAALRRILTLGALASLFVTLLGR